jgi:hypothetical protein
MASRVCGFLFIRGTEKKGAVEMNGRIAARGNSVPTGDALWELQNNLATVACYAAGEVDDLILDRPNGFVAVRRLLRMIKDALFGETFQGSPESLIEPTTAAAMNRALGHSNPALKDNLKTVDQLLAESRRVALSLEGVVKDPNRMKREEPAELERLRALCIALSDSALACAEPIDEGQPQTF